MVSVLKYERNLQSGFRNTKIHSEFIKDSVNNLNYGCTLEPSVDLSGRVTALQWKDACEFAVGYKNGGLCRFTISPKYRCDRSDVVDQSIIEPSGKAGYAVSSIAFVDEKILITNFSSDLVQFTPREASYNRKAFKLLQPDGEVWFTAMNHMNGVTYMGDNKGFLWFHDGRVVTEKKRLHKARVNHIEVSDDLVFTSSTDRTIKVWDPRNFNEPVYDFKHASGITCSRLNKFGELLVTDMCGELIIYDGFRLAKTIEHPHRQFQHITSIRACWHPQGFVFAAPRYPKKDENSAERRIDFYDMNNPEKPFKKIYSRSSKLVVLSEFCPNGDYLCAVEANQVQLYSTQNPEREI